MTLTLAMIDAAAKKLDGAAANREPPIFFVHPAWPREFAVQVIEQALADYPDAIIHRVAQLPKALEP